MNRRGTGVIFCLIAAILFSTKYISASVFASNTSSWDAKLFSHMLNYIGDTLTILSAISLIMGIIYLILAEKDNK